MNTFAIGSLPVHFSVAKLFTFRWQYTTEFQQAVFHYLTDINISGIPSELNLNYINFSSAQK